MTSLLESELDELYKAVKKGEALGRPRRWLAYTLKIVAGGASLVIATGKFGSINQELGIAILVAVFLDSVLSNHMQMIAERQAAHAYAALARRVKAQFNSNRDAATSEVEIVRLMKISHDALVSGIDEIQAKLDALEIKALVALSLDDQKKSGAP